MWNGLFGYYCLYIFYAYLGYGIVLLLLLKIKRTVCKTQKPQKKKLLSLKSTLFVAAYNEADYIREKVENTLAIDYPRDKLRIVFCHRWL